MMAITKELEEEETVCRRVPGCLEGCNSGWEMIAAVIEPVIRSANTHMLLTNILQPNKGLSHRPNLTAYFSQTYLNS